MVADSMQDLKDEVGKRAADLKQGVDTWVDEMFHKIETAKVDLILVELQKINTRLTAVETKLNEDEG